MVRQRLEAGAFRKQGSLDKVHPLQAPQSLWLLLPSVLIDFTWPRQ